MFWDAQERLTAARWLSKNTKVDQIRKNLASVKATLTGILTGKEKPPANEAADISIMRLKTMMEIWSMALSFATAN